MQKGDCMQKRHSIMVSEEIYKEIKKIKAELLINENMEIKNLGEVIKYIVEYYRKGGNRWK